MIVRRKDQSPIRRQAVGHGARDERVGHDRELVMAVHVAELVCQADGRIDVRPHNGKIAGHARVENRVVKFHITNIAGQIGGLGQPDHLRGKCSVAGRAAINDCLRLRQIAAYALELAAGKLQPGIPAGQLLLQSSVLKP